MRTVEVDVLVVGAGPTGLSAAALLARDGANVLVVTRYRGLANSPRAHIINQRTMEVFRDLGIEERISGAAMPADLMGQVVWAESFTGAEIGRRRGWGAGADRRSDYEAASPCVMTNIPQHVMEPILCDAARGFGAQVQFHTELTSIRQEAEQVVSTCLDRETGEEFAVVSQYAIGADGDNSTVCRELGFQVEGYSGLGHMFNYWIKADLSKYTAHRPGALYQIFRPGGQQHVDNAMFVNVRAWDEWVVSVPYDPGAGEPDRSEEATRGVVRAYVGDASLKVDLISTSTWTINQMYAEIMHQGRVVIAGNAAHRHPPAGGLGANTCIQDAFNLAWKLRLLLNGVAGMELLATYSQERAPVARQIVERANTSLGALMAIPSALGLAPGQSAAEGQEQLNRRFEDSEEGRSIRSRLAGALAVQDYNFNALGVEMGHHYDSEAITPDGAEPPHAQDPELHYAASTVPGARLPHAWLARGTEQLSTLDATGKGRFTLLTGIGGHVWREAAEEIARQGGLPLDVVSIGPGQDLEDPFGTWAHLRGTGEAGCLLVRPDHHIAFRAGRVPEIGVTVLAEALRRALAHPVAGG